MQFGYKCEDDDVAIYPATTRAELAWLRNRLHIVREVAAHTSGGLDTWIMDGLAFLDEHDGHAVVIVQRS